MPPPQGTYNPLEGPGDYTVTKTVHTDTYAAIDPTKVDHKGRAVLVTGGSRGIGKAMAISFARAGASHIAITGRAPAPAAVVDQIKAAASAAGHPPPTVLPLKMVLTEPASVDAAFAQVREVFPGGGRLDVVVSNAGVLETVATLGEGDPDEWWETWKVNVRGPYLVARAAMPLLLLGGERGLRTLVTTSSVGAFKITPGLSAYQPSKTAVVRLTQFIATEYGERGIIAFTIHPGNVFTDAIAPDGTLEGKPDWYKDVFIDSAELPGDTVAYLTAQRWSWLSGRYVNVTWDMPQLAAQSDAIVRGDRLTAKLDVDGLGAGA